SFRPRGSLWDGWVLTFAKDATTAMNGTGKPSRNFVWQSIGLNDIFGQGTPIDSFVNRMSRYRARFRTLVANSNVIFLGTNFYNPPDLTLSPSWTTVFQTTIPGQDSKYHEIPVIGATYMDAGSHWNYP